MFTFGQHRRRPLITRTPDTGPLSLWNGRIAVFHRNTQQRQRRDYGNGIRFFQGQRGGINRAPRWLVARALALRR